MSIDHDVWLSGILGYDAFRVSVSEDEGRSLLSSLSDLRSAIATRSPRRAFYYTKVPTQQVDTVHTLGALGFAVVDVNVTLGCRPETVRKTLAEEPVRVQEAGPAHALAIRDIAGACFVYSRFHLDRHIPDETAHAIKRAWVQSYLEKTRGERLFVGLIDGRPAGFLAALATTVRGEPCRVIDLIGVDQGKQGCGVGRALIEFFASDSVGRYPLMRVGTQAANIPSLRLYESVGFRVQETAYVLHAHVGTGVSRQ